MLNTSFNRPRLETLGNCSIPRNLTRFPSCLLQRAEIRGNSRVPTDSSSPRSSIPDFDSAGSTEPRCPVLEEEELFSDEAETAAPDLQGSPVSPRGSLAEHESGISACFDISAFGERSPHGDLSLERSETEPENETVTYSTIIIKSTRRGFLSSAPSSSSIPNRKSLYHSISFKISINLHMLCLLQRSPRKSSSKRCENSADADGAPSSESGDSIFSETSAQNVLLLDDKQEELFSVIAGTDQGTESSSSSESTNDSDTAHLLFSEQGVDGDHMASFWRVISSQETQGDPEDEFPG